jgi:hypothetical protein
MSFSDAMGFDEADAKEPQKYATYDNLTEGSARIGAQYNGGYYPKGSMYPGGRRGDMALMQLNRTKSREQHQSPGMAAMHMGHPGKPFVAARMNPLYKSSQTSSLANMSA